ncbi:hypothetical protein BIY29_06325 [Brenneria alni]|uniref:Gluconolactonase n=1 Tax=Brenneria alni TaxID=71656 RepID=A0A421DQJ0_9GAMM|nr:L-dopachrome tautomerase-related protein [Brenneria alni]RLM25897.1 hypothetical protein BIY29_06325 [Brenneria alni]
MKSFPHQAAKRWAELVIVGLVISWLGGLGLGNSVPAARASTNAAIEVAGHAEHRWTGVAVLANDKIVVNFPRWQPETPISVGLLDAVSGAIAPYPNAQTNAWEPGQGLDPATYWVCVQSVVAGPGGHLFALDSGRMPGGQVVAGAPKLVRIDSVTDTVVHTYLFDESIATEASYLNDIRFDASGRWGFITDSGAGALIVLDLQTGHARRLLAGHPSVMAEEIDVMIDGAAFRQRGQRPQIHADGIAVDGIRGWVYWQALTARTLYRLPIAALIDPDLSQKALAARIERVAEVGPSDGLEIDTQGRVYLTSIEHNAVRRWTPDGGIEMVAHHPRLSWPDSLAWGQDGSLYVTATQIHRGPAAQKPFELFRIPAGVVRGE